MNEVNAHCGKIWTDGKDNRLKYSNKKREKVIKMYLENVSIRSIERLEGVSEPLILKWIKKMGKEIKNQLKYLKMECLWVYLKVALNYQDNRKNCLE